MEELNQEIRFKDTDPDTGDITQDVLVCLTSIRYRDFIYCSFVETDDSNPNREYYYKTKTV